MNTYHIYCLPQILVLENVNKPLPLVPAHVSRPARLPFQCGTGNEVSLQRRKSPCSCAGTISGCSGKSKGKATSQPQLHPYVVIPRWENDLTPRGRERSLGIVLAIRKCAHFLIARIDRVYHPREPDLGGAAHACLMVNSYLMSLKA